MFQESKTKDSTKFLKQTSMETLEQTKDRNIKLTLLDFLKRNNDENEYQSDYIKNDWKIRRTDHVKK